MTHARAGLLGRGLAILACALGLEASARPVSFVGSKMVMLSGQSMMASLTVDATLVRGLALGATYGWMQRREDALDFAAADLNVLLWRLNGQGYQANAFLLGNAGVLLERGAARPAGAVTLEVDAESRRFYGLAQLRYLRSWDGRTEDVQGLARVGVAPFLAGFTEMNPFLVVQYQYLPRFAQAHVVTPMLRLLYRSVLLEVGISLRGEPLVNVTTEF
jgi:hypothetical protein